MTDQDVAFVLIVIALAYLLLPLPLGGNHGSEP
jgi:hypothetical protein